MDDKFMVKFMFSWDGLLLLNSLFGLNFELDFYATCRINTSQRHTTGLLSPCTSTDLAYAYPATALTAIVK